MYVYDLRPSQKRPTRKIALVVVEHACVQSKPNILYTNEQLSKEAACGPNPNARPAAGAGAQKLKDRKLIRRLKGGQGSFLHTKQGEEDKEGIARDGKLRLEAGYCMTL